MMAYIKKFHDWMMLEDRDDKTYEWFASGFLLLSSGYLSGVLVPEVFEIIWKQPIFYQGVIWLAILVVIRTVLYVVVNIYKLYGGIWQISSKYKLFVSVFSVPVIIFGYKIIPVFKKLLNNQNGRQN